MCIFSPFSSSPHHASSIYSQYLTTGRRDRGSATLPISVLPCPVIDPVQILRSQCRFILALQSPKMRGFQQVCHVRAFTLSSASCYTYPPPPLLRLGPNLRPLRRKLRLARSASSKSLCCLRTLGGCRQQDGRNVVLEYENEGLDMACVLKVTLQTGLSAPASVRFHPRTCRRNRRRTDCSLERRRTYRHLLPCPQVRRTGFASHAYIH